MLYKTKGIVLHSTKYSETSLIVKVFTENFGLQSYIIRSARSKKSKMKAGIFQPLTLLEFIAYHKKKSKLQTLKEIITCNQFDNIPYNIKKSSVALFIAEVLNKAIREEEQNVPLFEYIYSTVQLLDKKEGRISEFHLYFLLDLTKFLGFYPHNNYTESNNIFNLYDGRFQEYIHVHKYYIDKELSISLNKLIEISYENLDVIGISPLIRKKLINKILDYYRIHLSGFNTVQSHLVLENIFN